MILIQLDNVHKEYGLGDSKVHAIQGINLQINEGEFVAILGKSGSGKSTLLSLIGGLEQPSSGDVIYKGKNLSGLSEDELAILRRSEIGIIFQHFFLMDAMTALDNVELPLLIAGLPRSERRGWALETLDMVDLKHRAAHYPNELSGGERQRVGIARAFVNKANLIIADEPTGDLDSKKGEEIIDLMHDLLKGGKQFPSLDWSPTIIMVTHDVGMLRQGMRVITISDGRIIQDKVFTGDYEEFDSHGGPSKILGQTYGTD
ncbi:MAG: putative ABC transporter ATP-binding protein [Candidatus Heimdallarchaeota archaeon LC_2]|nr:MAG: putative ABC transporter ATP-binding protein [Candidatus Heimdallarchaeota archaeon LC_2]